MDVAPSNLSSGRLVWEVGGAVHLPGSSRVLVLKEGQDEDTGRRPLSDGRRVEGISWVS